MSKSVARYASGIDYKFRPSSYFNNLDPDTLIVASILGEERRKDVQQRLAAGDTLAGEDWLTESKLDDSTRKVIGSCHPAYMGGEYLPTIGDEEIEIARIVLASVTQDVISVRARRTGKRIAYRVVDEYDTEFAVAKKSSAQPLSLKELIKLIDGTNQDGGDSGLVFSVLDMNLDAGDDPDSMQDFIVVSSSFYPELGQHYAIEIDSYLADKRAVEEEDDEVVVADRPPCVLAQKMPTQLYDLQNLPEDPVLGAMRASEAAFKARSMTGNGADPSPARELPTVESKRPDYYTYKKHIYQCKKCDWQGLGSELQQGEMFDALFELDCPSCSETVTFVSYPTIDESRANWDHLSDRERANLERVVSRWDRFNAMSLKSHEQLPDIAASAFFITWNYEDDMTVLRYGDNIIHCEPALYEGYERYEEVALILKDRYGDALLDLAPSAASGFYLYGDRLSSPGRLKEFRQNLFNLPPGT